MARQRRQPVPPDAPPVLRDLTTELRTVVDHGFTSLRELEKVAHVSRSTLSDALSGRRLPSLDVLVAIVRACGADEDHWRDRWQATRCALIDAEEPEGSKPAEPASEDPEPAQRPAPADPPEPVLAPLADADPRRVGPFQLDGVLGSGTTGRVYLARTPGGRAVAVKVIRPEIADDPEFRRRFRREVDAARKVHGVFTAPVLDADPDGPRPWLATAYVAGPSLRQAVTEHGPLPVTSILRLAAGVAEALRCLHPTGLVHRDLTPGNVLLAADGPKVIDFGIAHARDGSQLTGTGVPVGTAAFMAPEQAVGGTVGPATDVFALGALLAFAATGRPPFGDGPVAALLYRVVHEEPDLTGIEDDDLRTLITRCLAKEPDTRPTTDELVRQLDPTGTLPGAWLPDPVAASLSRHVPAPPRRVTARLRRRLIFAGAAAIVAALLATGVLIDRDNTGHVAAAAPAARTSSTTRPHGTGTSASSPSTAGNAPPASASASAGSPPPAGAPAAGAAALPAITPQGTGTSTSRGGSATQPQSSGGGPAQQFAPATVAPTARMSFENGTDNWGPFWGEDELRESVTTRVAYDGTHSLLLTVASSSDKCAIGTDSVSGLHAGSVVTLHVWYGGQGAGDIWPFVQDTKFNQHFPQSPTPVRAGWQTITFTVPDVSIKGVGFQIDSNGGSSLVVALDAVNW